METKKFFTVSEYLAAQAPEIRDRLESIRQVILDLAPDVEERISYDMPAYFLQGRLVYFCAFKKHIGFYPADARVFEAFREELAPFPQSGRGTVRFPHDRPLPLELIRRMVDFRVRENRGTAFHSM